MNSTGTNHQFSKGEEQPDKKVDKKNKTSQIWKSGEASQQNLDNEIFFQQKILKVEGGGGASQKKTPLN
jgi:hypothetical protein